MPAVFPPLFDSLAGQNLVANATANGTENALQVICAWPVSSQYGPGSRVLYYVLVAACVVARKIEWLRNACLAAALLLPAVAALHGIVLAAVHIEGAVDMDVYGAFQICSIGILAANVTIRLSSTYFNNPGRNIIFAWTAFILAGLISLTVAFYRIEGASCPLYNDSGHLVGTTDFPYDANPTCGLTCSVDDGPFSPMRGGSANNIYIIPVPDKLSPGAATLMAAGCCIPAILWLVLTWNKILELNWRRTQLSEEDSYDNAPISGTNGATPATMRGVESVISDFLRRVEIPVFGGAVLAILIIGEVNFYSTPVSYQTEPMASIGQWSPVIGTGLAVMGSLYLLLASGGRKTQPSGNSTPPCDCPHCQVHHNHNQPDAGLSSSRGSGSVEGTPPNMQEIGTGLHQVLSTHSTSALDDLAVRPTFTHDSMGVTTRTLTEDSSRLRQPRASDASNKGKVTSALSAIGNWMVTPAADAFDDSDFRQGLANTFPETPGEIFKNPALLQIRDAYNSPAPDTPRPRSRAESFNKNTASGSAFEDGATPRASSPAPTVRRRPHASTFPADHPASISQDAAPSSESPSEGTFPGKLEPTKSRRDTLELPPSAHIAPPRDSHPSSVVPQAAPIVAVAEGEISPAVVVSADDGETPSLDDGANAVLTDATSVPDSPPILSPSPRRDLPP